MVGGGAEPVLATAHGVTNLIFAAARPSPALGPACSLLRAAPARARRAASSVQASNHAHLAAVTTVLREYLYSEQYSGFQTVIFL